ncbi:hypothetical protein [Alicyclobacillus acidocaldarius]|nr:hypothetical protein [Alicyclobacillus acidocaldarius]
MPVSNHTIIPFSATEQRNVCIHGLIVGECRSVVEEVQKLVEEERMRLQEFYERMNKSFVEDAETFTRWEKHRSILAKYIRELLSLSDIKRILVVGSGNCYDLDLHVFNEHEVVVTFIDIDAEATRRAIEDREPMLLQKANIIQMDILGWNDTLESIKAVFAQGDTQEILRAFKQAPKEISSFRTKRR